MSRSRSLNVMVDLLGMYWLIHFNIDHLRHIPTLILIYALFLCLKAYFMLCPIPGSLFFALFWWGSGLCLIMTKLNWKDAYYIIIIIILLLLLFCIIITCQARSVHVKLSRRLIGRRGRRQPGSGADVIVVLVGEVRWMWSNERLRWRGVYCGERRASFSSTTNLMSSHTPPRHHRSPWRSKATA